MATYTLSNTQSSFSFVTNGTTGISLDTFKRVGSSQNWQNTETALWKALVFDTTSGSPYTTSSILPTVATLGTINVVTTSAGQSLTLTWTNVPVGADRLTVVLSLVLNKTEDFLRARISASWPTVAKYALDSIGFLNLSVTALNPGTDYAVAPAVFGILSKDPMTNFRYNLGGGRPTTLFNGTTANTWTYPAGRGWNMGFWGYYDSTTSEGWMTHLENWSQETMSVRFEADGTHMIWEPFQPQTDHVLVGNNSQTLGSGYTFCLRPMLASVAASGWWDMAYFYRQRWEAGQPAGYVPVRPKRTDISDLEKGYWIFADISLSDTSHTLYDGKPGPLTTLLPSMRLNSGAPNSTPITGTIEQPTYGVEFVGETINNDLPGMLQSLSYDYSVYMTLWVPNDFGPKVWSTSRWNDAIEDESILRWWTLNSVPYSCRMSRKGYLDGGGLDRLLERSSGAYYRERQYPVVSWNGTNTLTVTGSPGTDGFTGNMKAVLIPASSLSRLASATITSLSGSNIIVTPPFVDSLGTTVVPDNTYLVEVYNVVDDDGDIAFQCPHAQVNSDTFMARLENNTTLGIAASNGLHGMYMDTYTEPLMASESARVQWCYHDHSSWPLVNFGYTRHSLGGGAWVRQARRTLVSNLKSSARDYLTNKGRAQFYLMSCEDIDEGMMDLFDFCWHTVTSGNLWRNVDNFDPAIHKYKTIPLYAVVHGGKTLGRGLNQEWSTATLNNAAPYNDATLHKFLAFCMAADWVYGLTVPTLSFYETNTIVLKDFWDDTQYVSGGGAISNTVKSIRDLWVQLITAEANWITTWFRYGQLLAPATLDAVNTDFTTGLAGAGSFGTTIYATTYTSYDTIYDRSSFPRVTHAAWKADDGSVCVIFCNWSDTAGKWAGTIDTLRAGLGALGSARLTSVVAKRLDYTGAESGTVTWSAATGKITLASVPAFSITAVMLTPPTDTGTIPGDPPSDVCSSFGFT